MKKDEALRLKLGKPQHLKFIIASRVILVNMPFAPNISHPLTVKWDPVTGSIQGNMSRNYGESPKYNSPVFSFPSCSYKKAGLFFLSPAPYACAEQILHRCLG